MANEELNHRDRRQGELGDDRTAGAPRDGSIAEISFVVAILAYSGVIDRLVPAALYVPTNLAAAAFAVAAARSLGVTWDAMGLRRDRVARGIRVGLVAVAVVAIAVAVVFAVPGGRRYLVDQRAVGGSGVHFAYQTIVRIPFGTALPEELIFRGALLGLLLQRHTRTAAIALSSTLFGLWHVAPTLGVLHADRVQALEHVDPLGVGLVVAGAVVATTVAGFGFAWLRFRASSLLAPIMAHASINSFALLAGRVAGA
jgi:membrane protease YdiL (CAAX protease family)